ncbi:MAG TPA: rhomboid family intramembrane serine protease, partial [Solirubrobacteraceae bacterium]|nr:rhomboid family intramembrane serine protease [Solirubrobacteraceae bacterium]
MSETTEKTTARQTAKEGVQVVTFLIAAMWVVQIVNSLDHYKLDQDGIVPRKVSHLYGIVTAPFLHASYSHIIGNTIPFVILGLVIAMAGPGRVALVTLIVGLTAGVGTWLTASSDSVTVGASGVVFGYATYVLARGFFNRKVAEIAIGVIVGLVFGLSLLWSLVPHSGVSWQDHLFGG